MYDYNIRAEAECSGKLRRIVGEARHDMRTDKDNGQLPIIVSTGDNVQIDRFHVNQILLACGLEPDCRPNQ